MSGEQHADTELPWNDKTAPNRVRPRECVGAARDALDRAYRIKERAAVPLLIEALDWLRRALEQMADEPNERAGLAVRRGDDLCCNPLASDSECASCPNGGI